jgi:hypothetical protein
MRSFPKIAQMTCVFDVWCRRAAAAGVAFSTVGFFPTSNGKLEGINNKIRSMQLIHYGLRAFEFISLRILTLHKAKHTFCG